MKLSKRLKAVAKLVGQGDAVCDVGTDHGYIPIYLLRSGVKKRALAMDINEGPLLRAREHVIENGLEGYIDMRLSDGLSALGEGEADSVVIAGMGGNLMIRILENDFSKLEAVKELILQPQSDVERVRRYVRNHGFVIDEQDMVEEDGKFYMMFRCVHRKDGGVCFEECEDNGRQRAYDRYGEHLMKRNDPVLRKYLKKEERQIQKIKESLSVSGDSGKAEKRKRELEEKMSVILLTRKEMDAYAVRESDRSD